MSGASHGAFHGTAPQPLTDVRPPPPTAPLPLVALIPSDAMGRDSLSRARSPVRAAQWAKQAIQWGVDHRPPNTSEGWETGAVQANDLKQFVPFVDHKRLSREDWLSAVAHWLSAVAPSVASVIVHDTKFLQGTGNRTISSIWHRLRPPIDAGSSISESGAATVRTLHGPAYMALNPAARNQPNYEHPKGKPSYIVELRLRYVLNLLMEVDSKCCSYSSLGSGVSVKVVSSPQQFNPQPVASFGYPLASSAQSSHQLPVAMPIVVPPPSGSMPPPVPPLMTNARAVPQPQPEADAAAPPLSPVSSR